MAKAIRSAVEGNMWYRRIGQLFLDILDKVEEGGGGTGKVDWDNLEGKPDTYPPSVHKHQTTDINNFSSAVASAVRGAGVATQSWVEWYAAQNNLQPKEFKPTINDLYNGYIQELYIEGSYDGQMAIYLLQDTSQDTRLFISDGNGHTIGKCVIEGSESFVPGNIYEIVDDDYYSGLHGYVVFSKAIPSGLAQQAVSNSLINNSVKNIFNSPMIFNKIFSWLAPKKEMGVEWTTNSEVNAVIEELYYPSMPNSASLYLLTDTDTSVRLFIMNGWTGEKDDKGNPIPNLIASVGRNINRNIRESKPIYSIYDYATRKTHLGYFIPSTLHDYNQQGDIAIYKAKVADLDNSPRIKAMLEDNRQVILIGDSIPSLMTYYDSTAPEGYRTSDENPMEDMLRSMLGCQVINLCCQGCTYAYRNNGLDYYDNFSAVKWADSLKAKSFSVQKLADLSQKKYPRAIANSALIDWGKNTTVICEYGTNDLTIGVPALGTLYDGSSPSKSTIMGAMAYAARTILTSFPAWKMCFVNLLNRTIDGTPISLYTNSTTGISAQMLRDALAENAERMGLPVVSGTDMAERNAFSLFTSTCDGTHNNEVGFFALAKFYARIYEGLNGDDKNEVAVKMDTTGDGGDIGTDTGGNGGTLYEVNNTEGWASGQSWDGHSCWQSPKISSGQCTTITVTPKTNCTLHIYSAGEENYDYLYCTTYSDDVSWQSSNDKPRVVSGQDKGGVVNQRQWLSAELTPGTTYYIRYVKDGSTDVSPDCGWWYID